VVKKQALMGRNGTLFPHLQFRDAVCGSDIVNTSRATAATQTVLSSEHLQRDGAMSVSDRHGALKF